MPLEKSPAEQADLDTPEGLPSDQGASFSPRSKVVQRIALMPPLAAPARDSNETLVDENLIGKQADPMMFGDLCLLEEEIAPGYVTRRMIGRGGCGEVHESWQVPLRRLVAVKRLRPDHYERASGDNSAIEQLDRALHHEALAMGALEHPNIAPIHDLAFDNTGHPVLVMKLVRGNPWNRLLMEDRELPMEEFLTRHLAILIQISQAVAFAHSRGIVHRDLKPAQVMVGDFGEVMLMDWGLSLVYDEKLISVERPGGECDAEFPTTQTGSGPAGTVAFMAPEQTEKTCHNIGPWTDVYLLGGILFYMLTGVPPHHAPDSRAAFHQAALGVVAMPVERIRPWDAPPELMTLARMALEPDRRDRIQTALEFVKGIQSYLSGSTRRKECLDLVEQVRARLAAGRLGYREMGDCENLLTRAQSLWAAHPDIPVLRERTVREFARQALNNADLTLARLLAERIASAKDREEMLEEISRRDNDRRAQRQQRAALVAATIIFFFGAMFWGLRSREKTLTAGLLERIDDLRTREAALAERIWRTIPMPDTIEVRSSENTGRQMDSNSVAALMKDSDALRRERAELLGEEAVAGRLDKPPLALVIAEANLALAQGQSRNDFRTAMARYEAVRKERPELIEPLVGLGIAAARAGESDVAVRTLSDAADRARISYGSDSIQYSRLLALAAEASQSVRDEADSYRTLYRQSLSILEPQWADLSLRIASYYGRLGDYESSTAYSSPTLRLLTTRSPGGDVRLFQATDEFLEALFALRQYSEAAPIAEQTLAQRRESLGDDHHLVATALWNLARIYERQGKRDAALSLFEEALAIREQVLGPEDLDTATAKDSLAEALIYFIDRTTERREADSLSFRAEQLYRDALKVREDRLGQHHPLVAESLRHLARLLWSRSRFEESVILNQRADTINQEALAPDHPSLATQYRTLANTYRAEGRYSEARPLLEQSLKARERAFGANSVEVVRVLQLEALLLLDQNRTAEAREVLAREQRISGSLKNAMKGFETLGMTYLGDSHWMDGNHAEAERLYRRAVAILQADAIPNDYIHRRLALMLAELGRDAEAREEAIISLRHAIRPERSSDPAQAVQFDNVGRLCGLLGLRQEALVLFQRNAEYSLAALGPHHINTVESTEEVAARLAEDSSPAARNARLVLLAWLDEIYGERRETAIRDVADDNGLGWAHVYTQLAEIHAQAGHRQAAQMFTRRAAALAAAAPSRWSNGRLGADIAGLEARLEAGPESLDVPSGALVREASPARTRDLLGWLDDVAPVPADWKQLWPDVQDWNREAAAIPTGATLQRRVETALRSVLDRIGTTDGVAVSREEP